MHELIPFLATFGLIFVAELPDKTMMATLVLSSRYRSWPVLIGVSAAFVVQSAIAVAAGGLLSLLPTWIVLLVVAVLFAVGAVLLFRESLNAPDETDVDGSGGLRFWPTVFTSFGVLFAAEWGDASQLATAGLAAHYGTPVLVFLGAALALIAVATLAILLGRVVVRFVPLKWIQRGASILFAAFAVIAVVELLRS
ncbi:TMEM165/GDT1 family protein [Stackebrandtia soli]|uniref:TMEM165/GDT1 family protein n=1 Tax=Stackebrandtia soli TaxID=1892856 RepID=UPI0039E93D02